MNSLKENFNMSPRRPRKKRQRVFVDIVIPQPFESILVTSCQDFVQVFILTFICNIAQTNPVKGLTFPLSIHPSNTWNNPSQTNSTLAASTSKPQVRLVNLQTGICISDKLKFF